MHSKQHCQPLNTILKSQKQQLAELMRKVNQLREFNQCFHAILDKNLMKHCQISQFNNGKLTVIADSAAWATKIRYQTPELIAHLSKHELFQTLKTIQCLISPTPITDDTNKNPRRIMRLSTDNIKLIQQTASAMKGKLKAALMRLGR